LSVVQAYDELMRARQIWAIVELVIGGIGLFCVLGGLFAVAHASAVGEWLFGGPVLGIIFGGSLAFGGLAVLLLFVKRNSGGAKK
jgi:hypothetical protein